MGWGHGLLAAGMLGLAGCASVPLPAPEAGFRAPRPYRHPAPQAGRAEREALFRAHRVSVNLPGFQVGAVPTGVEGLSAYWRASGAPEMAEQAAAAAQRVGRWQKATEASGIVGEQFPDQGAGGVVRGALLLGSTLFGAVADAEASAFPALAAQYNARLLKALGLPLIPALVGSVSTFPEPLGPARLELGLNAGLEDRVWERSVHLWQEPWRTGWPWLRPGRRTVYLIGGLPARPSEIEAHIRHHGGTALAERYAGGRRLRTAGFITSYGGALVAAVGFVSFFGGQPPYQEGPLNLGLGGLLVAAIGPVLIHNGTHAAHEAIHDFDRALPGRLRLGLGAKF